MFGTQRVNSTKMKKNQNLTTCVWYITYFIYFILQKINEKPQVINDYEAGRAIPNNQILSKIERIIGKIQEMFKMLNTVTSVCNVYLQFKLFLSVVVFV